MTCNHDFAFDVKAVKKSEPINVLTLAIKPGIVRRAHELLQDGTHIIDQRDKLKVISKTGHKTTTDLKIGENEIEILDIASIKGKNKSIVMLVKGLEEHGVLIQKLNEEHIPEDRLFVKFGENQTGVKIEGRVCEKDNTRVTVLLADGGLVMIDEEECLKAAKQVTLDDALSSGAAKIVKEGLNANDFTLSTDGKLYVVVEKEGNVVTTLNEDFETTCKWKADMEISSMRAIPALQQDSSVNSHNVIMWDTAGKLVLYHVKKSKNDTWQAWKTQTVTLRDFDGSKLLEVGTNSDVLVLASKDKPVMVVLRLSTATGSGCYVTGVNSFDCDATFGSFVSIVAKSERAGVRCSTRRTEGLFLHDISLSDITSLPSSHNDKTSLTMDDLQTQVKRLTRENERLKEENQILQSKKGQEVPPEFEEQLKETTKMVDETCQAMIKCHHDIAQRITQLEQDMKQTQQMQAKNIKKSEEQLETTSKQVTALVKESADHDTDLIKQLHVGVTQGLTKVQEDSTKDYQNLLNESKGNRMHEAKILTSELQKATQALLSEPGLARLKSMVMKSAFSPKETEVEEAAIKQAIHDSLRGELKKHLEQTTNVFLQQERETLNKHTSDLITKSKDLVANVGKEISAELKMGLEKLGNDTEASVDTKWQQQADSRLRDLFVEGLEVIAKMGNTTPSAVELIISKRRLRTSVDNEEFWKAGVPEMLKVSEQNKDDLMSYLCELCSHHVPAPCVGAEMAVAQSAMSFAVQVAKSLGNCTSTNQKILLLEAALDTAGTRTSTHEMNEVLEHVRPATNSMQTPPGALTKILAKCSTLHPHYQ
eukprot:TRINITY_DN10272_c0_g2_i1.p1 TRINITY_DN10272_c0_g2~~TRINITY_DN10272_c0_g2_i1.p1  ORF type:complete len:822 (+),score=239.24 TRINITY_DN10272_c0_g2_i1:72-2537(+)